MPIDLGKLKHLLSQHVYVCWEVPKIKKLRSGVLAFDIVTGGGIPINRFTEFHGDKSTGKSTFALRLIDRFLTEYPEYGAVYVDFEQTYDPAWASHFISKDNQKRLDVAQPQYGELGVDFIVEVSKHDSVGFIVVDSIATIIPTIEADSDAFKYNIGTQARLVNNMFRRLLPIMSNARVNNRPLTFLLLNQIRVKIDGSAKFGVQYTKPAGKMQDAIVSLDIRFYAKDYHKVNDIPVKATYMINVEKNKTGGHPKRIAEFTMYITPYKQFAIGDIDDLDTIIRYSRKCDLLIKDKGSWSLKGISAKNLLEVKELLQNNPVLKDEVSKVIVEKLSTDPQILLKEDSEE